MKKILVLPLVLVLALFMIACGNQNDEITIAVIGQHVGNMIFLPAQEGALKAGEDLGITVAWQSPKQAEAGLQKEIMNNLIEEGVDGIAISCTTGDALKDVIDCAVAEGIAVSCYDVDSPGSRRSFYAGTDNYNVGFICGEYMIELFKDSGLETVRVAQLEGIPGANDIEARKHGFADAVAGTNIEVVYSLPCQDDVARAIEGIEAYTHTSGAEIDAWFMAGGWPYCVHPGAMPELNAWKLADPNHKVVTVDIFPETTPAFFELGVLDVAIGQSFYNMGYESVANLYKLIKGEDLGLADDLAFGCPFINTGVQIATIDDYKEVMGLE